MHTSTPEGKVLKLLTTSPRTIAKLCTVPELSPHTMLWVFRTARGSTYTIAYANVRGEVRKNHARRTYHQGMWLRGCCLHNIIPIKRKLHRLELARQWGFNLSRSTVRLAQTQNCQPQAIILCNRLITK